MRQTNWMITWLSAGLLFSAGSGVAQGAGAGDQEFLTRAIRTNQTELRLGHMATERGSSPEVKTMGETMVKNHTELERQLEDLARKAGAPVNPELSTEQKSTIAHLGSLSGADFDQEFKQTLNATHVRELAMYQDEVNRAQDPQLNALAQKRVATLEKTVNQANKPAQTITKGW